MQQDQGLLQGNILITCQLSMSLGAKNTNCLHEFPQENTVDTIFKQNNFVVDNSVMV